MGSLSKNDLFVLGFVKAPFFTLFMLYFHVFYDDIIRKITFCTDDTTLISKCD